MKASVSGRADLVTLFHDICDRATKDERLWVNELRACGVVAAHPDDGWVNRELNTVQLAYPQFNDGIAEGSLIALGWEPYHGKRRHRVVRVVKRIPVRFMESWQFEPYPEQEA